MGSLQSGLLLWEMRALLADFLSECTAAFGKNVRKLAGHHSVFILEGDLVEA